MALRAVTDADTPQPAPNTLNEAAESSERALLVMMRKNISDTIGGGVPAHTLAPLMRQMREIDKEIRTLDARAEQDTAATDASKSASNSYDASAI